MLINLVPKKNYLALRQSHLRSLNKEANGLSKKEKKYWGIEKYSKKDASFNNIFIPTNIKGIYMSEFDGDIINCWCKQYALYSRKFYKKLKKFENFEEEVSFRKNCWTYGISDNLEQIVDFYNKNEDGYFKGNHVISCFEVYKNPDAPYCGWRWSKWGKYIGTQNHKCEYLNNEPEIEKVICFSIYKVY